MNQPALTNTKNGHAKKKSRTLFRFKEVARLLNSYRKKRKKSEGVKNDFGGEEWALGQSLGAMVSCDVTVRHTSMHISAWSRVRVKDSGVR